MPRDLGPKANKRVYEGIAGPAHMKKAKKQLVKNFTQPNALHETLTQRASTHGDFRANGRIMQHLKQAMRGQASWPDLEPHQREALEMIQHKIGRILCGNPNEADHWRDIAGYATLCQQIIEGTYSA